MLCLAIKNNRLNCREARAVSAQIRHTEDLTRDQQSHQRSSSDYRQHRGQRHSGPTGTQRAVRGALIRTAAASSAYKGDFTPCATSQRAQTAWASIIIVMVPVQSASDQQMSRHLAQRPHSCALMDADFMLEAQ